MTAETLAATSLRVNHHPTAPIAQLTEATQWNRLDGSGGGRPAVSMGNHPNRGTFVPVPVTEKDKANR
jgi:hypothetical protein